MAIDYHFDVYPAANPRDGTRLVRLSADNALQAADYRDVIGVGSGRAVLRATRPEAAFLTPEGEQYVRVVRDNGSSEVVVGGWWTNQAKYAAAVVNETKRLEVGGAATMAYLARAVMAPHTYIHGIFEGQDPFDGLWRLYAQSTVFAGGDKLGAMLWRVIYEAQHFRSGTSTYTHRHADGETYTDNHDNDRLRSAIPAVVMGFDQFEDSDGNPWTVGAGEFTARIGENVLEVVRRLMEAGLYVEMDPDTFELRAWEDNDHRRTRTGGAWGTNVVRLQASTDGTIATGNIKSDSERLISSYIRRTTVWSGGTADEYGIADTPTGIPWEGFAPSNVADRDALDQLAATQLAARSEAGDVLTARLKLGAAPASGRYLPWEHVKLDDVVTVHTGTDEWDYNEAEYPVGALRIHLRDGGDWDAWVDLGASYEAMERRQFEVSATGAHSHGPNPRLCRPGTIGGFAPIVSLGANGTCDPTNYNAGLVTGPRVERVRLELPIGVSVGQSIIVKGGYTLGTAPTVGVWDDGGNTYTLVANHKRTASGAQPRAMEWYTNVTNAMVAGQFITLEADVGASFLSTLETGCKAISAWLYDGTLSSPSQSGTGGAISSAPAVTVGAGDLISATVGVLGPNSDTITPDGDWTGFARAGGSGSAGTDYQIIGGFRLNSAGDTWNGTISQARDWSSVGAIYSTSAGGTTVNDGHPDLVGTSPRAARCDHRHDVHRATAPTVNDDWATAGYKLGTIWAQLDDLETPTAIVGAWILVDAATGAAVWLPLASSGGAELSDDTPLVESGSGSAGTSDEASRSDHVHPADGGGGGGTSPTWTTWTPTVTQSVSVPVSVDWARYAVVGKVTHFRMKLTANGTNGTTNNAITIGGQPAALQDADAAAGAAGAVIGYGTYHDAGTAFHGVQVVATGATSWNLRRWDQTAFYGVNPNIPMSGSAGDQIIVQGTVRTT